MKVEVSAILIAHSYTNVFVVDPPDNLSDYILISDSGGFGLSTEDYGFGRPTIQIIAANKNPATLETTIKSLTAFLAAEGATGTIQGFDILSDAIDIGKDEQLRYLKSINFIVYNNIL